MTCSRGLAHSVNGKLQCGKIGPSGARQFGGQPFEGAAGLGKAELCPDG
jgi:hypothetical protein